MTLQGEFFSKREGQRLVGQVYEIIYPYFGVPDGTRGRVIGIKAVPIVLGRGFELVVEWDLNPSTLGSTPRDEPVPQRSWLSKGEMERYMQRVVKGRIRRQFDGSDGHGPRPRRPRRRAPPNAA